MVEGGIDPREALRSKKRKAEMTVARAHQLYMVAVRKGRSLRAKRPNKLRTIKDKLDIHQRDIARSAITSAWSSPGNSGPLSVRQVRFISPRSAAILPPGDRGSHWLQSMVSQPWNHTDFDHSTLLG